MKNGKILLILSLSFVLLIVGASILYQKLQPTEGTDHFATFQPNPGNNNEDSERVTDGQENTPDSTEAESKDLATDPDAPDGNESDDSAVSEPADETESTQPSDPSESKPADDDESESVSEAESEPASEPETEEPSAPYPGYDFTVYDRNGNAVKLSDFVGKPVVLNFWASWCGPCQAEMPEFEKMYQELGDEVHFVMVNLTDGVSETVATASSFIDKKGYTFPVFFDTQSIAATVYQVYSIPTTFFIDAEGEDIYYISGSIGEETIRHGIDLVRS